MTFRRRHPPFPPQSCHRHAKVLLQSCQRTRSQRGKRKKRRTSLPLTIRPLHFRERRSQTQSVLPCFASAEINIGSTSAHTMSVLFFPRSPSCQLNHLVISSSGPVAPAPSRVARVPSCTQPRPFNPLSRENSLANAALVPDRKFNSPRACASSST